MTIENNYSLPLKINNFKASGKSETIGCKQYFDGGKVCGVVLFYLTGRPIQLCPSCQKTAAANELAEKKEALRLRRAKQKAEYMDRLKRKKVNIAGSFEIKRTYKNPASHKIWVQYKNSPEVKFESASEAGRFAGVRGETVMNWCQKIGGSQNGIYRARFDGSEYLPIAVKNKKPKKEYVKKERVSTKHKIWLKFKTNPEMLFDSYDDAAKFAKVGKDTILSWCKHIGGSLDGNWRARKDGSEYLPVKEKRKAPTAFKFAGKPVRVIKDGQVNDFKNAKEAGDFLGVSRERVIKLKNGHGVMPIGLRIENIKEIK
jgi:uncharacterized Zn finger protein (UPF0148 family)